jgi:hypothetical protein
MSATDKKNAQEGSDRKCCDIYRWPTSFSYAGNSVGCGLPSLTIKRFVDRFADSSEYDVVMLEGTNLSSYSEVFLEKRAIPHPHKTFPFLVNPKDALPYQELIKWTLY